MRTITPIPAKAARSTLVLAHIALTGLLAGNRNAKAWRVAEQARQAIRTQLRRQRRPA